MNLSVDIKKQLGDFSLQVQFEAGDEPLALLGASGCGKSLTLRCIAGILRPDEGRIVLGDQVLFDSAAKIDLPPQKRRVGYLFQQYALFPGMTVAQNIASAVPQRSKRKRITEEKLRQFRLEDIRDLRPYQLSGGQQQRTALARILASDPQAILLDEPLSALDSYLRYQLELELTETIEGFSGPVIWVSHDRGEAFRNCKNVCVLQNGHSQSVTTLEELFLTPSTEAAARLSGCKNFGDAVVQGSSVYIPQWDMTLPCGRTVPEDVGRVGIRAHFIHLAPEGHPCKVLRVIEDVFSTIVLLQPEGSASDAPPLRMELSKDEWQNQDRIFVTVEPEKILLLKRRDEE